MDYSNRNKRDISTSDDIKLMVDSFYTEVRKDRTIGPVFNAFIDDWSEHLPKMYRFWQTILLHEYTYKGSPFQPHMKLPINNTHFKIWLKLFHKTIDEHFSGKTADEAKWRSNKMAEIFQSKLKYIRKTNHK